MYMYNVHMKCRKEVSISEARENLPSLVRDAERGLAVTLTRRGEAVAVLISSDRYRDHTKSSARLGDAIDAFRKGHDLSQLDVDEVYAGVRDRSPGRDVDL